MAVDESSLLPNAPPPRPAQRDAAIEAALRRFDGKEESPATVTASSPRRSRWSFGGSPQTGALVTASLIVVIGLPAALIAIRSSDMPSPKLERPTPTNSKSAAADVAPTPTPAQLQPVVSQKPTTEVPANLPSPDRRQHLSDEEEIAAEPGAPAVPVEPPTAAIAAAPAPPPPPPSAAERDETISEDGQIVVTGSLIRSPAPMSESIRDGRGRSQAFAQKNNARATAPKWVLEDGAYRTFLGELQAAVRSNNRPAVVRLIRLPLRVNFSAGARTYRESRSVLADHDRIFTPRVKQAILTQRFENLFGRDQGVMIGNGEVWFDHVCRATSCSPPGPVRITAINP